MGLSLGPKGPGGPVVLPGPQTGKRMGNRVMIGYMI